MPRSIAGLKSLSRILSNAGAWNGSALGLSSGFCRTGAFGGAFVAGYWPAAADAAKNPAMMNTVRRRSYWPITS
jgi:hypothetical protein